MGKTHDQHLFASERAPAFELAAGPEIYQSNFQAQVYFRFEISRSRRFRGAQENSRRIFRPMNKDILSRDLDPHGRPLADVWVCTARSVKASAVSTRTTGDECKNKPIEQELLDQGLAVTVQD